MKFKPGKNYFSYITFGTSWDSSCWYPISRISSYPPR